MFFGMITIRRRVRWRSRPKNRKQRSGQTMDWKKPIVTLKGGDKIVLTWADLDFQ
jgi:ribosomal protein L23